MIDVKKYKNYIKNHKSWDHKYYSVLHLDPFKRSGCRKIIKITSKVEKETNIVTSFH
jgi:hypothetical protein